MPWCAEPFVPFQCVRRFESPKQKTLMSGFKDLLDRCVSDDPEIHHTDSGVDSSRGREEDVLKRDRSPAVGPPTEDGWDAPHQTTVSESHSTENVSLWKTDSKKNVPIPGTENTVVMETDLQKTAGIPCFHWRTGWKRDLIWAGLQSSRPPPDWSDTLKPPFSLSR